MNVRVHGVPLVDQVIERIRRRGWNGAEPPEITNPHPLADEAIAGLRMPGDKPLSPSLRRWLSFDGGWLAKVGWYENPASPELVGGSLSEVADQMYDFGDTEHVWTEMFEEFEVLLPGRCLPLVGGSDSRRVLYVGEADSLGEYPVLALDTDDIPFVGVMYPGLDVYLAHEAGVLELDFDTYTSLIDHPEYGSRMQEHAVRTGLGPDGKDIGDLYARPAEAALDEA